MNAKRNFEAMDHLDDDALWDSIDRAEGKFQLGLAKQQSQYTIELINADFAILDLEQPDISSNEYRVRKLELSKRRRGTLGFARLVGLQQTRMNRRQEIEESKRLRTAIFEHMKASKVAGDEPSDYDTELWKNISYNSKSEEGKA